MRDVIRILIAKHAIEAGSDNMALLWCVCMHACFAICNCHKSDFQGVSESALGTVDDHYDNTNAVT